MVRGELLFDGNEKQVYATDDPEMVLFHFKDVATAYNNVKKAVFPNKGIVNNKISSLVFEYLRDNGVFTHYVEKVNDREQLCRKIGVIPIEFVIRNYIAGSLADRLGLDEGTKPQTVIYDLYYNNESLGDPMINDSEAVAIGLISEEDLAKVYQAGKRINSLLADLFSRAGIKLIDLKLEFGRTSDGQIILSDEISPDTCRLWDAQTNKRLDKDRFCQDLGNIVASYEIVLNRLEAIK